jgi:WD40 repeat protein
MALTSLRATHLQAASTSCLGCPVAASPVVSVEFSPDGKMLAARGYQKVRLIDSGSGNPLATLSGHADYVRSLAFGPDGKMLAAAGGPPQHGGEIKIWDVYSHQLRKTLLGHEDCIDSVAWSPDGKLLASGSYDKGVKLWDATTGQAVKTLREHTDTVLAVTFSPHGEYVASGSQDRSIKVWDVASGRRLYNFRDAGDGLTNIAFSPSGNRIAVVNYDKTVHVWPVGESGGRPLHSSIADQDCVLALAWTPDGKTLITSSADGSIRFRDAATLHPVGVIGYQPEWVDALSISPDGRRLAAGCYNGTLSLYDVKSFKEVMGPWMAFGSHEPPEREPEQTASR